jgi:hypothetical protein
MERTLSLIIAMVSGLMLAQAVLADDDHKKIKDQEKSVESNPKTKKVDQDE